VPGKADEVDLGDNTLQPTHRFEARGFVGDPAVTRKERHRLADVLRRRRDIKHQPRVARICFFGQVKSESAVIHRFRCIFKKLPLRCS
jgi:hypothetical protein